MKYRIWMVLLLIGALTFSVGANVAEAQQRAVVRMVYFYANDCSHCQTVMEEVLKPLKNEHGDQMQIKMIEISEAENYELLIRAEEMFDVTPEERALPTLVIDGQVLIGEDVIRQRLPCLLNTCLGEGGTSWPDIPGLEQVTAGAEGGLGTGLGLGLTDDQLEPCGEEEAAACEGPAPIWAAYFYQVGCQECSRAEYDIRYVKGSYPQLMVAEYNVQENAALAEWLGERAGVPEGQRLTTPAIFIGEDYLIADEITPQALQALVEKYVPTGAEKSWADFSPEDARQNIIERFESFGALTVVFAGLVDGLNPCAFATLIFFVSYLTFLGRKGLGVLAVGAAFTLGVFLTYTLVGFGLWRLLSTVPFLKTLGRYVYAITAVLCALLAGLSLLDYLKARQGQVKDMTLVMPEGLRKRVHTVIRRAGGMQAFTLAALPVGAAVSLLELACTGQVYLPTIMFVVSVPELQAQASLLLILYNFAFILPLIVVFMLVYFGTTSLQLSLFLKRHAATVKLGTALLFASLAVWLGLSLI